MGFLQEPPRLGNQFDDDALLQEYLDRHLPVPLYHSLEEELRELGQLGATYHQRQLEDRLNLPVLTQWGPWGTREDHIELSPLWKEAQKLTAASALVATAYDSGLGAHARTVMFAKNYLVQASLDMYSCPLAMTDGAARTLLAMNNQTLIQRALPHLLSKDPQEAWTSGQWMTERTGGSDVGLTEAVAKPHPEGFRLYGVKWFTSASSSQMALTLARPEGNGPGGKGLALFYLETRLPDGRPNHLVLHRLKDKLGTRKVPTAELTLDGTWALPVGELSNGIRNITPMLNITRTWNCMGAAWGMRRAIALVRDYAHKRVQFGDVLAKKPLHADTVAGIAAETEGAFHLAFRVAALLGLIESGQATERDQLLFRLLTPLAKLTTGKQAVAVASEATECFGGAGYVEDTGIPVLLRDAQVLPIWEGTTNVLSLDALRAMSREPCFEVLGEEIHALLDSVTDASLAECARTARQALAHAQRWWVSEAASGGWEAGARRFALTLGRSYTLALMVNHAQWAAEKPGGKRAKAAARRFAAQGVDLLQPLDPADAQALMS